MPEERREVVDVQAMIDELEKEFTEVPEEQPEEQVEQTPQVEEQVTEEPKVEAEPEIKPSEPKVQEQVQVPQQVNDPDIHKRNEAFKQLREERDKLAKSDAFMESLAKQYGMSKDELIERFESDKVKKEAERLQMPIEQFKRMQELEREVNRMKESRALEAFNYEADRLVQKYNLNQEQAMQVFKDIGQMGVDVMANPKLLEFAYKALNYDKAIEMGRQNQLVETKKRRETAPSPTLGTKGANVNSTEADMDNEIDAYLKSKLG